jgi:DNA-binding GntR family transcriptional regulator
MIGDLWGRVGPYLKLLMHADRYIPQSNDAHRKIVAALEQRSGSTVRIFIEEDIAVAAAVLSANLGAAS